MSFRLFWQLPEVDLPAGRQGNLMYRFLDSARNDRLKLEMTKNNEALYLRT